MGGTIHTLEVDGSGTTAFRRTLSLLLPVFLLGALMIMVADRADASTTAGAAVATASASTATAGASTSAQFSIAAIICPILLFLRAAFGPFFAGIFNSLLAAFGCIAAPSGVVPPGGGGGDGDTDD